MIGTALKLLALDEWYGVSESVEIAKGKYECVSTVKQAINKTKRLHKWLKK